MNTECAERDRLIRAYTAYLSDHLRSVQVLGRRVGVLRKEDYLNIRPGEDRARRLALQAKMELDRHIADHGCIDEEVKLMTAGALS
jgi:hypothetical protein